MFTIKPKCIHDFIQWIRYIITFAYSYGVQCLTTDLGHASVRLTQIETDQSYLFTPFSRGRPRATDCHDLRKRSTIIAGVISYNKGQRGIVWPLLQRVKNVPLVVNVFQGVGVTVPGTFPNAVAPHLTGQSSNRPDRSMTLCQLSRKSVFLSFVSSFWNNAWCWETRLMSFPAAVVDVHT